jgi:UDP-galactopyranose mutase (EC 5.4.99.9)
VSNGIQFETEKGTPQFDRGVSAAPPAYTERELLATGVRDHRESYWENRTYAPSAFLLYLGVEGEIETLDHHSLVLPTDWEPHFNSIFDEKRWPENPSYYLNVPTATDDTVAPDGHSTLVILVPIAPGLPDNEAQRQQFRSRVFDDIAAYTGVDLRGRIVFQEEACISEFAAMGYPDGTALGLAHTLRQTGPFRPDHRSTAVPGLYYVGSFTNPGIGMPMCLISAEHVTQAIRNDVDSDRSSRFSRLNPMKARN